MPSLDQQFDYLHLNDSQNVVPLHKATKKHKYSRYTVQPPQLVQLYNIPLNNTHIAHNHTLQYTDTILEYSVHCIDLCMLRRELTSILPDFNLSDKTVPLYCIVSIQHAQYDLTEFTPNNEQEKNKLLQCFYRWALSICHILLNYNKKLPNNTYNTLAGRTVPIQPCCNVYNNNTSHTHSTPVNSKVKNVYLDQILYSDSEKWYMDEEKVFDTSISDTDSDPQPKPIYADFIDPCTGLPVLTEPSGTIYGEVDGIQTLLRYPTENIGFCSILQHPKWNAACYPASIFTTASIEQIEYAITKTNQLFHGTTCTYDMVLQQNSV